MTSSKLVRGHQKYEHGSCFANETILTALDHIYRNLIPHQTEPKYRNYRVPQGWGVFDPIMLESVGDQSLKSYSQLYWFYKRLKY